MVCIIRRWGYNFMVFDRSLILFWIWYWYDFDMVVALISLIWFRNGATFRGFLVSWPELLVHFLRLLVFLFDFDMVVLFWYGIRYHGLGYGFWHGSDMILIFCQNIYPNNTTKPEYTKVTALSHAKITILSHIRIALKQCQNHNWNTRPQTNVSNNNSYLNHTYFEYPSSWACWCHKFKHDRNSHLETVVTCTQTSKPLPGYLMNFGEPWLCAVKFNSSETCIALKGVRSFVWRLWKHVCGTLQTTFSRTFQTWVLNGIQLGCWVALSSDEITR